MGSTETWPNGEKRSQEGLRLIKAFDLIKDQQERDRILAIVEEAAEKAEKNKKS